ncbi:MAG: hypothetical protein E7L18_04860 [Finegoldia magna]|nr:hypothetical protein [Finegoldia magna]
MKTVKRIDKKDVRKNIAKDIYKEYNVDNKRFLRLKLAKVNKKRRKI